MSSLLLPDNKISVLGYRVRGGVGGGVRLPSKQAGEVIRRGSVL